MIFVSAESILIVRIACETRFGFDEISRFDCWKSRLGRVLFGLNINCVLMAFYIFVCVWSRGIRWNLFLKKLYRVWKTYSFLVKKLLSCLKYWKSAAVDLLIWNFVYCYRVEILWLIWIFTLVKHNLYLTCLKLPSFIENLDWNIWNINISLSETSFNGFLICIIRHWYFTLLQY